MTETLVCLASSHVDNLGLSEGFTALVSDEIERMFEPSQIWLGPRALLETDERYRQLVSYVVVRYKTQVLVYQRTKKGGEARLHGRKSLGIGGHWNVSDVMSNEGTIDPIATMHRACERELFEELDGVVTDRIQVVGVIKESANAVSRVHLGVVVECWLSNCDVRLRDPGLSDLRLVSPSELPAISDSLETWSSSLVAYLQAPTENNNV